MRRALALPVLLIAFAGVGCGDDEAAGPSATMPEAPRAPETTTDVPRTTTTMSTVTTATTIVAPSTTSPETGAVGEAFARTAASTLPLRMNWWQGQDLRSSEFGLSTVVEIDPERPDMVAEVAPSGAMYFFMDFGAQMSASVPGAPPAVRESLDQIHWDLWIVEDELIIDATSWQVLVDLIPDAEVEFGPFAPGMGVVDLGVIEVTGSEVIAQAAGAWIPDLALAADRLPDVLTDVEQDPDDPNTYVASLPLMDWSESVGFGDTNTVMDLAIGMAAAFGESVDAEMADFLVPLFDAMQSELTVRVGDDGMIESIRLVTDASGLFDAMLDPDSGLGLGYGDEELARQREAPADAVFTMEVYMTFDFDETIMVTPPEGDFEDRTADFVRFVGGVGG